MPKCSLDADTIIVVHAGNMALKAMHCSVTFNNAATSEAHQRLHVDRLQHSLSIMQFHGRQRRTSSSYV
jgi:hypothetical protein